MQNTLIIAEKPSVARDIAQVVGASHSSQGFISGNGYHVTWALGHLVTLPEPHEINPAWRKWQANNLPLWPEHWPLKVIEKTKHQFSVIQALLKVCDQIICATDAGREGELIFRYLMAALENHLPVQRLWISSLTPEAIREGLNKLKPNSHYDSLAVAAQTRSQADWLIGMNYSRAYAVATGEPFFVGRVQTPTLKLVVDRDLSIRNFTPEDYIDIKATFDSGQGLYTSSYIGEATEFTHGQESVKALRLAPDAIESQAIESRVKSGVARVKNIRDTEDRQLPPLLYDLTELQRHAHRLFGFSAQKTMDVAQSLYEKHKLISYPRTDSRYLSSDLQDTFSGIVDVIRRPYESELTPETGRTHLGTRFVNDKEVTDHHAILPTSVSARGCSCSADEIRIYDLICRRFLSAWQENHVTAVTHIFTAVKSTAHEDLFHTLGTVIKEQGWKRLDLKPAREPDFLENALSLPENLQIHWPVTLTNLKSKRKTTRPPVPLTEATLLTQMETAGRKLEDKDLARVMRESGLGTPATRAQIIETLLARGYLVREEKFLRATPLGLRLIELVHDSVKSPELTARWERDLSLIQSGQKTRNEFMQDLRSEVEERIREALQTPPSAIFKPIEDLEHILKTVFGFESFRPKQKEICESVVSGSDTLLVMPTGAGKSLCYQLPGIARGGTTLVISPLLALIEDQVAQLQSLGLLADRLHSGRSKEESKKAWIDHLKGRLQFLFIAPERLAVSGFIEFLKRRPLSLIAIDEAHCISEWGHDFRPSYRLLGQKLAELRPASVIAMTATATPLVQQDIIEQLNFENPSCFIQGFRRENIAIRILQTEPVHRTSLILNLLTQEKSCPAIIYAPTRKICEQIHKDLAPHFRAGLYHAGLSAQKRESSQNLFVSGQLDVIVATVAFGMGIDKKEVRTVIHAGLPGSLENYYQEIGRAGRDGLPAMAFLLHSFSDFKTHEFLLAKNYPEPRWLKELFETLTSNPMPQTQLAKHFSDMPADLFQKALERLLNHHGAILDAEKNLSPGSSQWEPLYEKQRLHRHHQWHQVSAFIESPTCRMQTLVQYFGDQTASRPCGLCDICSPPIQDDIWTDNLIHELSSQR